MAEEPRFATKPQNITTMPPGIPYIVGNEAAERFSFYGMKAILTVFMVDYMTNASGEMAAVSEGTAKTWVHNFVAAAYFTPLIGALLSDWLFGKYRTILWLSIVYVIGHFTLAVTLNHEILGGVISPKMGLFLGLALIALGTGAIKPCVSAHVGDQFGQGNKHRLGEVFGWFYIAINLGAFISTLLTPVLLVRYGADIAFGVPGVLMAIATFVFWLGRNKFVHVPARGEKLFKDAFTGEGLGVILKLIPLYIFVAAFWCLFDQTASAWVLQAKKMNTAVLGWDILPSQVQALNPFFILALIPLFNYILYPMIDRHWRMTPLRKIGIGMFLAAASFAVSAMIEAAIAAGQTPHISWQVLAYFVLTAAEVMVSVTCLEFSYTQSPNSMKSVVMALYLLSVAAGNEFVAVVNMVITNADGSSLLPGASYYWFFTGVMLVAAVCYIPFAMFYRGKTYIQDDDPDHGATIERADIDAMSSEG
ncbi:POT family MFS transporter [Stratiformator vulcanicus]|uniref:Dipeptide and tripeptide permease A n=1 Tax=Stratiformator vulcanicus TaxID=2527980 RepID=A0A517QYR3_9PLAN|nr:POT family MFS transporter [Stratiformator vulcanicus]QDT36797.1 Dipeptide and tripeptide permease A [Stratiformator vulcanicus]